MFRLLYCLEKVVHWLSHALSLNWILLLFKVYIKRPAPGASIHHEHPWSVTVSSTIVVITQVLSGIVRGARSVQGVPGCLIFELFSTDLHFPPLWWSLDNIRKGIVKYLSPVLILVTPIWIGVRLSLVHLVVVPLPLSSAFLIFVHSISLSFLSFLTYSITLWFLIHYLSISVWMHLLNFICVCVQNWLHFSYNGALLALWFIGMLSHLSDPSGSCVVSLFNLLVVHVKF